MKHLIAELTHIGQTNQLQYTMEIHWTSPYGLFPLAGKWIGGIVVMNIVIRM